MDLRAATVVTVYQLPLVNELLRPLFEAQLRPGARVVSLDFPVPGWSATRVVTATLPDGSQHAVHLYLIGQTPEVIMAQASHVPGRVAVELGGTSAGMVTSAEGGTASADVVTEKLGPGGIVRKHLAGVKYDDITITCGTGMTSAFYAWIADTLNRNYSRKDGAIVAGDFDFKEVWRLSFHNALVSEVVFPGLDAGSKAAASLALVLTPEYTRRQPGTGVRLASASGGSRKQWHASTFRLQIDGLDCSRVNRVDAISIRQTVPQDALGELRDYVKEPAYLEIPNLVVTMPESHAASFSAWADDFINQGHQRGERREDRHTGIPLVGHERRSLQADVPRPRHLQGGFAEARSGG